MHFVVLRAVSLFSLLIAGVHTSSMSSDASEEIFDPNDTSPKRDFRWSYFYNLEKRCTGICQGSGKPYGRKLGSVCQCYCPIIAPDWTLCSGTFPSCDNFCRAQKFRLGGECLTGGDQCYCYCTPREFYNASQVYPKPEEVETQDFFIWSIPVVQVDDENEELLINRRPFIDEENSETIPQQRPKPLHGPIMTPGIQLDSKNVTGGGHHNSSINIPIPNVPTNVTVPANIPQISYTESDEYYETGQQDYIYS